jgi:hypothetical protein
MQQRSRHCCCLNTGMQSRHCRASVQSQVEHQQLAPCIWCCAAKVEHGCISRLSQGGCKVLHHLTCSTCCCCCCGSSADEVKGYIQGHRGQGKQSDNHKSVECRGCGLFWNTSIMPNPSPSF